MNWDSRRTHRTTTSWGRGMVAAGIFTVLALTAGIGIAQAQTSSGRAAKPTSQAAVPRREGPPPVKLATSTATLLIHPYTACWSDEHGGTCYDGIPPKPPASLGELFGPVTLSFAAATWKFSVTATDNAGHQTKLRLVPLDDGRWRLALDALARGRYRLDIFGNGPEGDVAAVGGLTISSRG